MARVVLGVSGGIAAYKSCELLRRLRESGHNVKVVPTANALRFVGAPTWEALSGQPVSHDTFSDVDQVAHVRLGQEADLVIVAPATANVLAKAAHGMADDLLTNILLTARCPVVLAPAMHTEMWEHVATQDNVATLRRRGSIVLEPAVGRLTGVDSGKGRMPEPAELAAMVEHLLARPVGRPEVGPDLQGIRVLISAGGTREPIDPVRFIGNRSSGKQGFALAMAAAARGAHVELVAANVAFPAPAGVTVFDVESAAELQQRVNELAAHADVVVMAAAIADFRPASAAAHKIKKEAGQAPTIELEATADVLAGLVASRATRNPGQLLVGFAAETGDEEHTWLQHGERKLAAKGCDLLVVNEVGGGLAFGTDDNAAVVLTRDGEQVRIETGPKVVLADAVWDLVAARLPDRHHG